MSHYSTWEQNIGANSAPMTPREFQIAHPTMSTQQAEAAAKASGNRA